MQLCNAVLTGHMMHSVGSLPLLFPFPGILESQSNMQQSRVQAILASTASSCIPNQPGPRATSFNAGRAH